MCIGVSPNIRQQFIFNDAERSKALQELKRDSVPDHSYAACFKISKSDMKAKIETHNKKLGGVEF